MTGVLLKPGKTSPWVPDNEPARGVWYYPDPKAMAAAARLAGVRGAVLAADTSPNPGGLPAGQAPGVRISNRHLEYALTWYGLALVLAAIYFIFHWRREDASDERS